MSKKREINAQVGIPDPFGRDIARIERFIDTKGNLRPGVSESGFEYYLINHPVSRLQNSTAYGNEQYNYNRSALQNFKNLKELSKDC
ncbi:MAG: hypothetical protein LBU22_12820 [Dysgonamonadaceae bacterium]|nr:hypothetical protein [Dysgonamonadaceae bacterium]